MTWFIVCKHKKCKSGVRNLTYNTGHNLSCYTQWLVAVLEEEPGGIQHQIGSSHKGEDFHSFSQLNHFLAWVEELISVMQDSCVSVKHQITLSYQGSICSIYLREESCQGPWSQLPARFLSICQVPTVLTAQKKIFHILRHNISLRVN